MLKACSQLLLIFAASVWVAMLQDRYKPAGELFSVKFWTDPETNVQDQTRATPRGVSCTSLNAVTLPTALLSSNLLLERTNYAVCCPACL